MEDKDSSNYVLVDFDSTDSYFELSNEFFKSVKRFGKLTKQLHKYPGLGLLQSSEKAYKRLPYGPFKGPGVIDFYDHFGVRLAPSIRHRTITLEGGIKWSPLSNPPTLDLTSFITNYQELVRHIDLAFSIVKTLYEPSLASQESTPPSKDSILRARLKILAANELLSSLNKILGSLITEELPEQISPEPTNFIKDNKIPAPDDDHIKREQLPLSIAEDIADTLDLMDKEMATILTISIRTYHRLKQKGLLNPVASERLIMLKDLAEYGLEVFEDQRNFNEWLRSPLHELNNKSPLSLLDTATGIARVKTILGQIDYGVFS